MGRKRYETPLIDQFRFHLWVADLLAAAGLLSTIFRKLSDWSPYIPSEEKRLSVSAWWRAAVDFFSDHGWAPILGASAIVVYVLGRSFARYSVEVLPTLFTDSRLPTATNIESPSGVYAKTYGQLLIIILMLVSAFFSITAFCIFLVFLHTYYAWFGNAQETHMTRLFGDGRYEPELEHPHKPFIEHRRAAVLRYLGMPHMWRELIPVIGALGALVLAYGWLLRLPADIAIYAYPAVVAGMAINELLVWLWRRQLKRRIREANSEQIRSDIDRGL